MIRTDITKDEIKKIYRITKLNYVCNLMTHEDKIKKVFQYTNLENYEQCFKEIFEFNNFSTSSPNKVEHYFNSLDNQAQLNYLLKGLLDINDVDEWFDIHDELLASTLFKENINKYEWYEVMPLTVISNKELDERVSHILHGLKHNSTSGFSEYMRKNIDNYNPKIAHMSFDELDVDNKLYIWFSPT